MRNLKKNQKSMEVKEEKSEGSIKFGMNLKRITKNLLFIIIGFALINVLSFNSIEEKTLVEREMIDTTVYVENIKDTFNIKLITEVDNYIKRMAPNTGLNSEYLVEKCLEYNIDIVFVLSQALLESHFGTKGKAAATNSVWNVGTYDNGKILYTYDDPNKSIEPYLKLINEKYLINVNSQGDTIYKDLTHLIEDKGYINYNGDRFASAKSYENYLRKIMVKIDLETKISFYQQLSTLTLDEIITYFMPRNNNNTILYTQYTNKNGNNSTTKRKV